MKGTVDRIEETFAVCEMDGRIMQNIPLSAFTEQPKDGDIFDFENGIAVLKPAETEERKEEIQSLFERLKKKEQALLGWSAKRELAKINYRIHTDAIKTNLIPAELTPQQTSVIYASEADVLNMALFGMTAKQWREEHPDKKGNIRDYASINELICLSNMENINAVLIEDGLSQKERLIKLNKIAIHQMSILEEQNPKVLK